MNFFFGSVSQLQSRCLCCDKPLSLLLAGGSFSVTRLTGEIIWKIRWLVGWLNNLEEFPSRLQLTSWMFMLAPCTQPPWQKHLLQAWTWGSHFPDFEHLWRFWELPLMANLTFSMSYLHCTAENVHSPLQHDVVVALQSCPRCSHCRHASALRCGGGICS